MRAYDLVIFDSDGVLVDSEPIINRVFVEMMAELGHRLSYKAVLAEFSGTATAYRLKTFRKRIGFEPPEGFVEAYRDRIARAIKTELRPVSGVAELLDRLTVPVCVASNGTLRDLRGRLSVAGLIDHFEPHLFSGVELGRAKPDPGLFLHAARALGATPERSVVIEDSVPGVQAGVRAGMRVFGYAKRTERGALERAGAETFLAMAELFAPLGLGSG